MLRTLSKRTQLGGLLSFTILWVLKENRLSGQELADELYRRRGQRPTPGTLYPALKELREKGLATMEKRGRCTYYSLTPEGLATASDFANYLCLAFQDVFSQSGFNQQISSHGGNVFRLKHTDRLASEP